MKWNAHGTQFARSVWHFKMAGATPTDVFNALNAHVTATMWAHTDVSVGVQELDILPLDGSSATMSFLTSLAAKWCGTGGAGDYEIAPAALVKAQTGLRGPANRGRLFLPFPSEPVVAAGQLAGTTVTAMQTAWTNFLAAMIAVPCFPVIASYTHADAHNVTGYTVEQFLGTQRRRQSTLRRA